MNEIIYTESNNYSKGYSHDFRTFPNLMEEIIHQLEENREDDGERNVQLALQLIEKAITADPTYPGYFIMKGKILLAWNEIESGIDSLSKAVALNPGFSDRYFSPGAAHYLRGMAYSNSLNFKDAWSDFTTAAELGSEEAKEALNKLYTDQDQYVLGDLTIPMEPIEISNEDTEKLFAQAMELFTKSKESVNTEKVSWSDIDILQQNKKAIYYLEEAIKQNPSDVKNYILLGKLNVAIFQTDRAIDNLSKAIAMNPNFSNQYFPPGEALFERGKAYFSDLNNKKARENFNAAIEQFDHKEAEIFIQFVK